MAVITIKPKAVIMPLSLNIRGKKPFSMSPEVEEIVNNLIKSKELLVNDDDQHNAESEEPIHGTGSTRLDREIKAAIRASGLLTKD